MVRSSCAFASAPLTCDREAACWRDGAAEGLPVTACETAASQPGSANGDACGGLFASRLRRRPTLPPWACRTPQRAGGPRSSVAPRSGTLTLRRSEAQYISSTRQRGPTKPLHDPVDHGCAQSAAARFVAAPAEDDGRERKALASAGPPHGCRRSPRWEPANHWRWWSLHLMCVSRIPR